MTDRAVGGLAVAALAGALVARAGWPSALLLACALAGAVASLRVSALLLVPAVFLGSAGLAVRALDGLAPPRRGDLAATDSVLLTDPRPIERAVRVDLRLADGRRVEAWARGRPAGALRRMLAGERAVVAGWLAPVPPGSARFAVPRHIAARLALESVDPVSRGSPLARVTNELRRTLERGLGSFEPGRRALVLGFLLGDDREQTLGDIEDFRAAGLSHLLAVSGQNVAFAMALAAPLLRRLGFRARLCAGAAVLVTFGALTRWEPSVIRAVAMAFVTLVAFTTARPATTVRVLALAVAALLLVDPLLARSLGFRLSVAACAGIAVVGPALRRRGMPEVLAVTLAAQAGVAPLLVAAFDGVPLAGIPANVLAVPAAGPLMIWGLAAGLPAGLAGGHVAALMHVPTALLAAWIAGVARVLGNAPFGRLEAVHLVAAAALVAVALLARRPALTAMGAGAIAVHATLAPPPPIDELAPGITVYRSRGATVVVAAEGRPAPLLAALRRGAVRRVDLLVVRHGQAKPNLPLPVRAVVGRADVLVPREAAVGPFVVAMRPVPGAVEVQVRSLRAAGARAPPLRRHHARPGDGHPQPHARLVLRQGHLLRARRLAPARRRAGAGRRRHPRRRRCQGRSRPRGHRGGGARASVAGRRGAGGAVRHADLDRHLAGHRGARRL